MITHSFFIANATGVTFLNAEKVLDAETTVLSLTVRDNRSAADSLEKKIKNASLIIRGKVLQTNIQDKQAAKSISEHDPVFRKAIIEIKEVLKGKINTKKLVVYYASSDDVQWYGSPKPVKGQESVFLFNTERGARSLNIPGYTLLDVHGVQSIDQAQNIRRLIKKR